MSHLTRIAATTSLLTCGTLWAPHASAQTDAGPILFYEPIDVVVDYAAEGAVGLEAPAAATARISAFGRLYIAELAQNRGLIRNLPPETRATIADVAIWEGTLDNIPGSWIRLVQRGDFAAGTFSDGTMLYRIERFEYARDRLVNPNPQDAGGLIVYALPDPIAPLGDLVVGGDVVEASDLAAASTYQKPSISSAAALEKPALQTGFVVEIALALAADFALLYGAEAQAEAIARMNDADGLFVQQIGLHLGIAELQVFTSEPDPFDGNDAEALLQQLRNYTLATPAFAAADLAHLFTVRDLGTNGQTQLVGIANLGGVCSPGQGVAISAVPAATITAHEIAHNFGVPHDGAAGSVCAAAPAGYLMAPTIDGNSENLSTFSACSTDVLRQTIESASCLSPIPVSDLVLSVTSAPTDVFGNLTFGIDFDLESVGAYDSLVLELSVASPSASILDIRWPNNFPGVDCQRQTFSALCTFRSLPANSSLPFETRFNATEAGPIAINLEAWSYNDENLGNNSASVAINVAGAVELDAQNISVSPALAVPGQLISVSFDLLNRGVVEATNVQIEVRRNLDYFEFVSANLPGGSACTPTSDNRNMICPAGNIPVAGRSRIEIVMRALGSDLPGNVQVGASLGLNYWADQQSTGSGSANANLGVTNASADVRLSMAGPQRVREGNEVVFSLTLENLGPDVADGMELTFTEPGLEIYFPGLVGCTIRDDRVQIRCPVPQTHAGESRQFTVGGYARTPGTYSAQAAVTVAAREADLANNSASFDWTVAEAPVSTPPPSGGSSASSGGGGGGGAMSLFWLCLLGSAGCLSRLLHGSAAGNRGAAIPPRRRQAQGSISGK